MCDCSALGRDGEEETENIFEKPLCETLNTDPKSSKNTKHNKKQKGRS